MEQVNPWSQVVLLLSYLSSGSKSAAGKSWPPVYTHTVRATRIEIADKPRQAISDAAPRNKITAIEREDDVSALVSWCDPTKCHYVDQVWRQVMARSNGYCALTGKPIRRGERVFMPNGRGRLRPVNHGEMILATALERTD
ncbi:DUF3331 domain-containing protein [Paraburkholderia acidicola]|uniref:DUF3331 domain-containing protein n=1 Tax=Paraburkholderia acidicola TaxID=1912599 RepID=A0ABV1LLJ9_9BURK